MLIDDRLATVLRHRVDGGRAARTQYRQLLDLLGSGEPAGDDRLLRAAWDRMERLRVVIPAAERAHILQEGGWRLRSIPLARHLTTDAAPEVAASGLARAHLTGEQWAGLIPDLPLVVRGYLRSRKDLPDEALALLDHLGIFDRSLPPPSVDGEEMPPPAQPGPTDTDADAANASPGWADDGVQTPFLFNGTDEDLNDMWIEDDTEVAGRAHDDAPEEAALGVAPDQDTLTRAGDDIAAIVRRIEEFSSTRRNGSPPDRPAAKAQQRSYEGARLTHFFFETDRTGKIVRADIDNIGMVFGMPILDIAEKAHGDGHNIADDFAQRRSLSGIERTIRGAPAIAGDWVIDAVPQCDPESGEFSNYAGIFRRSGRSVAAEAAAGIADRLRQTLHELRTPVNAIQGFAEVIQQQLFGPTPNRYRAMAAQIAGDAARMLDGFDELERLARLQHGGMTLDRSASDLAGCVIGVAAQLDAVLARSGAGIELAVGQEIECVALAQEETTTLVWRLLLLFVTATGRAETLNIFLHQRDDSVIMECDLPASLAAAGDLFAEKPRSDDGASRSSMFGSRFAMHLSRAEAQSVGGDLFVRGSTLILTLPAVVLGSGADRFDEAQE